MWGHKAIGLQVTGKGKDNAKWYHGNKGKGQGKGGTKGFNKGKGKGMNNFEYCQQRWQAPSSFYDVLLLERTTGSVHNVPEKEQHTQVNRSTTPRAISDTLQEWKVPVKRIRTPAKNSKKKLQVRNRFEVLRADDE